MNPHKRRLTWARNIYLALIVLWTFLFVVSLLFDLRAENWRLYVFPLLIATCSYVAYSTHKQLKSLRT